MQKLSLFALFAIVLLLASDVDAWRRIRFRGRRLLRNIGTATAIIQAGSALAGAVGRDVSASDVDGDGVMTRSEMSAMLGERATEEHIDDLMELADENDDGTLTRRELEDFMQQF